MRPSGDGWDVELWIAPCIPLHCIFGNSKMSGVRNLITNFGLSSLNYKEMDA